MSEKPRRSVAELMADQGLIDAAIQRAARRAVLEHARAGRDMPLVRDGKVVWVPAAEILASLPNDKPAE